MITLMAMVIVYVGVSQIVRKIKSDPESALRFGMMLKKMFSR